MKRWSLKQSILIGCILFTALLCAVISLVSYQTAKQIKYRSYEDFIRGVLEYTASGIDTDDLAACIRTGETSPSYAALQRELDRIKEHMGLHYLYIVIPVSDDATDNIINVIVAETSEEYAVMTDRPVYLNMPSGDTYAPETARKYLQAYESGRLSFFREKSAWGEDYTGLLPLYDSRGEKVAALCVDLDIREIGSQLRGQTIATVAATAVTGVLFALMFAFWAVRLVARPIETLERSVSNFARGSGQQDPDALVLCVPEMHAAREVESLAGAVKEMSRNLRESVQNMLNTEKELARVSILARKDALTKVGNKTAYAQYCEELQADLSEKREPFAVVMADANDLKGINDAFGHEKGDVYLIRCSEVICKTYAHSPVFRVGGDEFVAILRGQDYADRDLLLASARSRFDQTASDRTAPAWERASASLGMSEFDPDRDHSVEEVLSRADQAMYEEKRKNNHMR